MTTELFAKRLTRYKQKFTDTMTIKEIKASETWEIRQRVMWPDKSLEFVMLKNDDAGTHYGLYDDHALVSVVSCFDTNGETQFRKLATLTDKQRQGYATYLLTHIIAVAQKKGIKKIWCNARATKKSFYEKFGLVDTGKGFLKENIAYAVMELVFSKG